MQIIKMKAKQIDFRYLNLIELSRVEKEMVSLFILHN